MEQINLSEHQQRVVWEGMLSAKIRAHYFADLCHKYQHLQRVLTWATLATSSGAAVTVLSSMPPSLAWLRPVLALGTAALSLWSLVATYNQKGADCADLHFRWNKLAIDFEALWTDMYLPTAQETFAALREAEAQLAKSSTPFPNDERRMRKWTRYIVDHHAAQATA
jgi:hypothetical protein